MKRGKLLLVIFILFVNACNNTQSSSGITSFSDLQENFVDASSSLLPNIQAVGDAGISASLSYSDDDFSTFYNAYTNYLTEIFGSASEEPRVVTKVRVLLENFNSDHITTLGIIDPNLNCEASAQASEIGVSVSPLPDSNTVEIAFFGNIDNGSSSDRHFDCIAIIPEDEEARETVYLYGRDNAGNVYLVEQDGMIDVENTEVVESRGNRKTLVQVVYGIYSQTENSSERSIQLDLIYSQATIYSGVDNSISSSTDNIIFKSRSHITGESRFLLSDNSLISSTGQFNIIKYDKDWRDDSQVVMYSQSMGRGHFEAEGNFLFTYNKVENSTSLTSGAQSFCVKQENGAELSASDQSNCSSFETSLPYSSLNFEPIVSINESYESNSLFTPDDLIANDANNFAIPSYE